MEKYSRWSDLTTGVNPFVPHKQRWHDNIAVRAVQILGGSVLVVVRIALLTVVGLVLILTNLLVSILGFLPFIGRFLKRLTEWLLCSLLLLILGVFVSTEEANTRRLGLTTPGAKASSSTRIASKDLIVCNHTSFLEILYLARRFSPTFVFVTEDGASKGLVHPCGLIEAIYRACALPSTSDKGVVRKLTDVIAKASGPVVIFPEGARTNGMTVLRFLPILDKLPLQIGKTPLRIHLLAFRFDFKNFSPSHTAGRGWKHVLWTCFHVYHSLVVTHLHANHIKLDEPAAPSSTTSRFSKQHAPPAKPTDVTATQVERLRGLLAAMLRSKTVDLTVKDFLSFNAYWDHVTSGGKQSAASFTDRKAPHEHAQWTSRQTL